MPVKGLFGFLIPKFKVFDSNARTFAEDLTLNAKARLAGALPPSQYRDLLVSMADWFVNRLK